MKLCRFAVALLASLTAASLAPGAHAGEKSQPNAHNPGSAPFAGHPILSEQRFPGSDGKDWTLADALGDGQFLVVTFFSSSCPCQAAHDSRLRDLHKQWHSQGARFISIDSEADSSLAIDIREAERRDYPFPILSDREGKLADLFDAKFATFTVILDREGNIRYRGGIDSDKSRLTDNARHYVRTALAQLFAGQEANPKEGKALGCFLRRR